ncbi:MAG: bifunctional oligoribonuclease/PAP phosphatase NrnA [Desulfobulbaceae bacterium]|nr:bifunctional oligoribonuclease/PAP phosphatase NrnA [Desulfobulbaceae bacterium]
MKVVPEDISRIIRNTDNFVLMTHLHPDGDALGSLFALADILESQGKKVFRYLEDPLSHLYEFLPGCHLGQTDLAALQTFVAGANGNIAAISLDCGDCDRLGREKRELLNLHPFLVIDHHRGHREFGDYRWLDAHRSSTGEMVYELAMELDVEPSYIAAYNLYVAISTDTGSFRYENTSPRTLQIAAELVKSGVRPEEVAGYVYDNFTLQRLRLMEQVLATLQLFEADQLAFITVTNKMLADCGAMREDAEGFINYPRALRTVKVAVFLKETPEGGVSVSLRAKGGCDVAEVAADFGGGGHRNAAGFRLADQKVSEVQDQVLQALKKALG